MLNFVLSMATAGVIVLSAGAAHAQAGSGQGYPYKPIRIVTGEPGGTTDLASRLIGPVLTSNLGQNVVVDNRPSGIILGETVAKAPPDGHTLLVTGSTFVIGSLLQKQSFDQIRDFAPITLIGSAPNILVVHPSVAATSVKELIALAKARPGELNFGTSGAGSSNHLAGELFKSMAGIDIVRIAYKGTGPAVTALIGGQGQLMFGTVGAVMPHVKTGRLRALAATSAAPSTLVPGLPTVAAGGLPGYESAAIVAMFAPAKTPARTVTILNQEVIKVINLANVKEKFFDLGVETVGSSSQQLAANMKSELVRMGKVIKDAGIRIE